MIICSFVYSSRGKMWDRDMKITKYNFVRKRKPTGYICLPVSRYREAEGYLKPRPCFQDTVINYASRIGKYTNKLEM